jgi:phosphoribosylglycinamide formyltransferase-1
MVNIAIFASGTGSNAKQLLSYFEHHPTLKISLIATNNKDAGVLQFADEFGVEKLVFTSLELREGKVLRDLQRQNIDYIILAGFLALIPTTLVSAYSDKIINIHPSLLPKYGGKGMYGHFVHEAVVANKETISGMSIHLVNEEFDKGKILFQATTRLSPEDDANAVQQKVLMLEHQHFAKVVEALVSDINLSSNII